MSETSEDFFFLIDTEGRRRIPFKQRNRNDGRYGYSILPVGKGNDPSAGEYTEDPIRLVRRIVLDNQLVRAEVVGGKQDGGSQVAGQTAGKLGHQVGGGRRHHEKVRFARKADMADVVLALPVEQIGEHMIGRQRSYRQRRDEFLRRLRQHAPHPSPALA